MRRAKILATLGPASDTAETLEAMIKAGMNAVRINMSHGTHDEHAVRLKPHAPLRRNIISRSPCWLTCRDRKFAREN